MLHRANIRAHSGWRTFEPGPNELEHKGVEYEFIAMPGRGHSFDTDMSDPTIAATFDRVGLF